MFGLNLEEFLLLSSVTEKLQNHWAEDQVIWPVEKVFGLPSNRLVLFQQHDNGHYPSADSLIHFVAFV